MKRALVAMAAMLLAIPLMAAVASAASAAPALHQRTGVFAATIPHVTQHPTRRACGTAKAGFASCLAVGRTDVAAHRGLFAADAAPAGYGPADLQSAYDLPSASAGAGETVAIVDAYDDPNAEADLQVYRAQYGLPVCDSANGCFTKVAQDGSANLPHADSGWAVEISLDLDMVSAVCPLCHILLVEANDDAISNLGTAVDEAVTLGAKFVSNSYGASEYSEDTSVNSYWDHPGVAITVASGDQGYNVEYPAASPNVTAVGGTTLTKDTGAVRGWDESAWSGAGSGCSAYQAKPSWQTDSGCANRTVADVSADANPDTGVAVYVTYQATGWSVWGGTSAAAPIIASTYALAGAPAAGSYPSTYPYAATSSLHDVTTGSNGTCTPAYLCTAGTGYDGPTGLGTPDGVAAFTTGPHGTVSGTVTDASTGKPITDAEVDIGDQPTYTNSAGGYDLSVPVGNYPVTAQKWEYASKSVSGVQVTSGQSVTEDFALQPVPTVTLSGLVTDGAGQGWPLYAKVSATGTPAVTYTDPSTGRYSLTLPENTAYDLTVNAVYPGYQEQRQSIQVGSSSLTQNVSVPVNQTSCDALGYHYSYSGNTETFDDTTVPAGWSVVNGPTSTGGWAFNDPPGLPDNTGGSGNFAIADSNTTGAVYDTELVSPVTDLSQDTTPYVQFGSDLNGWFGDNESVDVSVDGGQTWTTVWQVTDRAGKRGPDLESVPLPMAAGKPQVQVRFHYVSTFGYWWELDNIFIGNRACVPTSGGLVEGVVNDGNTGAGVNGAVVTSVSDPSVTATAAAADPSVGDGFYYMFMPAAGSQQFTAAKLNYASATATGNVTASGTTNVNLTLQAGQLAVTPGSVTKTVAMGSAKSQNVTLKDTGKVPVNVNLYEQPGGFTMLGLPGAAPGAPPQRIHGTFTPYSLARGGKSAGASRHASPYAAPWIPVANYPAKIMDNGVATDTGTGRVYSVGGTDGSYALATGYVYDPGTQQWTKLPSMSYAREAPQAAFINGKLYVVGGWGADGTPVTQMEIYDPSLGTWSAGASIPVAWGGAGVAVLNGSMYVIGGCGTNCGRTDVEAYNPATNSWRTAAAYPEPISWQACGAITGKIYCAGGTAGIGTKNGYVYDPVLDTWSPIAPMPEGLWGSGYTAANGELLVSGGATSDSSIITNQGYAYFPGSNTWQELPNANNADYRGGSSCGLYRIGGSIGQFQAQNFAEQLPGYADCAASHVPWLSESQSKVTLNPGQSVTVTITMNAGDPSVTQPGAYTGALLASTDSPYAAPSISLMMNASPPKTWGKIAGTVSGLACDGTKVPLAGAIVQVDSWATSYTLSTSQAGLYGLWLDHRNNPLTLIAALDGWQPQTVTVKIVKGGVLTTNFVLKPIRACS